MWIDKITVHCSDSPQGRGDTAETIHRWHQQRGWDGIGYHYVILENGKIEKGRPDFWRGAHVGGHNEGNIGICLIGKGGDMTEEQEDSLRQLCEGLLHQWPEAHLDGHRAYDIGKTCPGFEVRDWYYDSQD